jgi:uncharacterized protein (TIGR02466 family)
MTTQTMGLFPEPVSRYTVWAKNWQPKLDTEPLEFRNNHSYSLNDRVLDNYPELGSVIERTVNDFAGSVMGITDTLWITQSWINVYQQGQLIHQHNHPNSVISGTWYWSTPPTEILFHKHGLNSQTTWTMRLDIDTKVGSGFSIKTNSIQVEENDLLLWPSYLQHSVSEHTDTEPRKTLSFNAMPRTWGSDLYRVI